MKNNEAIDHISIDKYGNLIANGDFNNFLRTLDDFKQFEFKRIINIVY